MGAPRGSRVVEPPEYPPPDALRATAWPTRDTSRPLRLRRCIARVERRRNAAGQQPRRLGPRLPAARACPVARLHDDGPDLSVLPVRRWRFHLARSRAAARAWCGPRATAQHSPAARREDRRARPAAAHARVLVAGPGPIPAVGRAAAHRSLLSARGI